MVSPPFSPPPFCRREPSISPQKTPCTNPCPRFTCCTQNDILTVLFSPSCRCKKFWFILLPHAKIIKYNFIPVKFHNRPELDVWLNGDYDPQYFVSSAALWMGKKFFLLARSSILVYHACCKKWYTYYSHHCIEVHNVKKTLYNILRMSELMCFTADKFAHDVSWIHD